MTKFIKRIASYLWSYGNSDSWNAVYSLLEKGDTFLELGCSVGTDTTALAKRIGANKVYGVDLDDEDLRKASEKGIITYKADLNKKFPLDDESVDVVFAHWVIEHIIDMDNFVFEIYRVLKKGGYAIIGTENLASWPNIFALTLGKQPYTGPFVSVRYVVGPHPMQHCCRQSIENTFQAAYTDHNVVLAYKSFRRIFELYGFKIEKVIGSGYYPFPKIMARALCRLDPAHSHFLTLKARKPDVE